MVKFRQFTFREHKTVEEKEQGFFGGERMVTKQVRAYNTTLELYQAVAAFATSLGHRLITISGTPWGESDSTYMNGEVVVWYHE